MTLQFFRFSKDDIFQWVSSVFTLFKLRSDEFTLVSLLYIYGIKIASSIGVIVSKYKDPVMNQSGFYIDNVMSGFLIPVSPSCTQAIFFKTQFLSAAQRKKGPWLFRVYRDCGDYFINHDTRNPVIKSNQDLNGKDWAVVFLNVAGSCAASQDVRPCTTALSMGMLGPYEPSLTWQTFAARNCPLARLWGGGGWNFLDGW